MLHPIVKKVNQHLHDQPGIHGHHQEPLQAPLPGFPAGRTSRHLRYGPTQSFLHSFRLLFNDHPALLKPGQAQNVFHEGMEPDGILYGSPSAKSNRGSLFHIHNHFRGSMIPDSGVLRSSPGAGCPGIVPALRQGNSSRPGMRSIASATHSSME